MASVECNLSGEDVLVLILCFILPCVGVYIKGQKFDANFWLALVLVRERPRAISICSQRSHRSDDPSLLSRSPLADDLRGHLPFRHHLRVPLLLRGVQNQVFLIGRGKITLQVKKPVLFYSLLAAVLALAVAVATASSFFDRRAASFSTALIQTVPTTKSKTAIMG